jgi:predicted phage terminase large subunit-like protein
VAVNDDVTAELRAMTSEQLDALMAGMTDDEVAVVQEALAAPELAEAIGQDPNADWRQDPATMGFYLTNSAHAGKKLRLWPYVRLLGEKYRQAYDGESIRQIWNLPPRYGKSVYGSQWGPAWALDRDPTHRIILASYGDSLALENAMAVRQILRDYNASLRVTLQQDRQQQSRFTTTQGGGIKAAGIGSAVTGFPADGLIVDDPFKNWQEAHSGARRDRIENEFKGTLMSRLEADDAYVIVIHHRVHEDDLTGRLLAQMDQGGERWDLVRIPELAEVYNPADQRPEFRIPDLLGREPGQPIERQRFSLKGVLAKHVSRGSYLTNLMYQQSPVPEEGGEIKRAWWKLEAVFPERYDEAITSWDLKMKNSETGDYVVGQYWGRTGKDFWFEDMLRGQWNQATTENAIALMAVRHPDVRVHHVEAAGLAPEVKASLTQPHAGYQVSDEIAGDLGMTIGERIQVSALRRRGMGGIILKPPKGSKEVRVRAISGRIEAGDCHLPERASWLGAFIDECSSFPEGTYDDMVDAMSQAIQRLMKGRASTVVPRGEIGAARIDSRGAGTMTIVETGLPGVAGQRQPVTRTSAGVMMPKIDPTGGRR